MYMYTYTLCTLLTSNSWIQHFICICVIKNDSLVTNAVKSEQFSNCIIMSVKINTVTYKIYLIADPCTLIFFALFIVIFSVTFFSPQVLVVPLIL